MFVLAKFVARPFLLSGVVPPRIFQVAPVRSPMMLNGCVPPWANATVGCQVAVRAVIVDSFSVGSLQRA
eukprot:3525691-Lingulodinium_polyedra.AAC.1